MQHELETTYSDRDLLMIFLGAKITAEILASEYDDDKICQTILADLITLSSSKDREYSLDKLTETLRKNLYQ